MERIKKEKSRITTVFLLSYQLAKANFKVKNEGSYLGIIWYLLNPISYFVVLLFLGGSIYNNSVQYYPAYLLLGLIMFNFFLSVTGSSSSVISGNKGYIKSIKIDPLTFVFANVLTNIFSHAIEILLFIALLLYLKINILFMLFYPLIFIFLCLFTTGISLIFATVGVYISDWQNIWKVLGSLLWFVTPVFYVIKKSKTPIGQINYFNPFFHFLTVARNIIIYEKPPTTFSVLGIIAFGVIAFLVGLYIFNRKAHSFAENV